MHDNVNHSEMKKNLFNEFPPVSTSEWEDKIREELKGGDYQKKLIWKTGEGFTVKPYYSAEDLIELEHLDTFPGDFPFIRGKNVSGNTWRIRQDIKVRDLKEANQKALDILMKGVDSLGFILSEDQIYSKEDLDQLLKNIFAEIVEINFNCGKNALNMLENHYEMIQRYNRDFSKISGSVDFDPLGCLVIKGNYYSSHEEDFNIIKKLISIATYLPHFHVINIHGDYFNNAGASIVEELAFTLSQGAEYLTQLTERELSISQVVPKIRFTFAIGSNYFMEIAKIRVARMLWAHIVKAYGLSRDDISAIYIHAVTSRWNKAIYDPYVNMLRTTTESMSAIIAGIDSLTVNPFSDVYEEPAEFSERIARNQQLLLKEESYLDQVADPSAGAYYIEQLTDSIAAEAWKLFLEVDALGGFIEALKQGFIQKKVSETANQRNLDIATRKTVVLGVNQYPDFDEAFGGNIKFDQEVDLSSGENLLFNPVRQYRGAEAFEFLRYNTDRFSLTHKRPAAFMLTYGNLAIRIARSQFSRNFFACAGFEVIDNDGFTTVENGIKASLESKAEIVIVCSADEEYRQIVPEIFRQLKGHAIVVVAGYQKDIVDELKAIGVEHFIHIRSNVLETLQNFQQQLGIGR